MIIIQSMRRQESWYTDILDDSKLKKVRNVTIRIGRKLLR